MMAAGDVWVIDDDRSIRWVLHNALEREGFSVTTFEDTSGALRQLARARPDAIMSDIRMPGGDGLDLLKDISTVLADEQVSVESVQSDVDKKTMKAELRIAIAVPGLPTLSRAIDRLEQIPNITSVRRNA